MQNIDNNSGDSHTLSVYVANKPGYSLDCADFSRGAVSISIRSWFSSSMDGKFSRMTITAIGDRTGLQQIIEAVKKLVDVIHCVDHTGENVL